MKLRYNYRIHPAPEQRETLARFFGCARVVYNDGLRMRNEAYKRGEPFITDAQLQKLVITAAKKSEERQWLKEARRRPRPGGCTPEPPAAQTESAQNGKGGERA